MPKKQPTDIKRKIRASLDYRYLVGDAEQAQAVVRKAQSGYRMALASGDPDAMTTAEAKLEEATAAEEACWARIRLYALRPPLSVSKLAAEHPPTDEQKADGAEWDPETFHPALIAACAEDAGLTEEQWAEEFASGRWSDADRNELFNTALAVNLTTAHQRWQASRVGL